MRYPLIYGNGDFMGVVYYAKMIDEFGISLNNPMTGGAEGSNMYDYPYSDTLSFLIVDAIGLFTDNPYLMINLFYFSCTFIIAFTSLYVCMKRLKNPFIAVVLSVLYANTPFIQFRYGHMWLIPFFMLPLVCDIALDILDGNIMDAEKPWWKNITYYRCLIIAFLSSQTGLYYAYFACALFAIAIVLRIIKTLKVRENLYPIQFIITTMFGCVLNYIPNYFYYRHNGKNPLSEINIRQIGDCEYYSLKFVQLLLPREGHRLKYMAGLNQKYIENYPLVTENNTASLGVIASIGFLIALFWIFSNKKDKNKSFLIISVFLVATIGGLSSVISMLVSIPMRCYNRISLVIMFLSLLCVGECLEYLGEKIPKIIFAVLLALILVIGIYDQTVREVQYDTNIIDAHREFVSEIENQMEENDMIYEIPFVRWPSQGNYRLLIGYMYSHNLKWSFGAMQGRPESNWQEQLSGEAPENMIRTIIDAGYKGLYLDMVAYDSIYGEGSSQNMIATLSDILGVQPEVSKDGELYFWNMNGYINDNTAEEAA